MTIHTKKARGRRARKKGGNWERQVAKTLKAVLPEAKVKRYFQSDGGVDFPDVGAEKFWIECKCGKRPPLRGALAQARRYCPSTSVPIAAVKEDFSEPIVLMLWSDWVQLVSDWYSYRKELD